MEARLPRRKFKHADIALPDMVAGSVTTAEAPEHVELTAGMYYKIRFSLIKNLAHIVNRSSWKWGSMTICLDTYLMTGMAAPESAAIP